MENPWNLANIISFGLFGLTAVGLFFTAGQALSARKARDAAHEANEAATKHERAALDAQQRATLAAEEAAAASTRSADSAAVAAAASERSAAALERQNELTELSQTPPRDPWVVQREHGYTWAAVNETGFTLLWASIGTPLGYNETRIEVPDNPFEDVPPGGKLRFEVVDPAAHSVPMQITWANPETNQQETWAKEVIVR